MESKHFFLPITSLYLFLYIKIIFFYLLPFFFFLFNFPEASAHSLISLPLFSLFSFSFPYRCCPSTSPSSSLNDWSIFCQIEGFVVVEELGVEVDGDAISEERTRPPSSPPRSATAGLSPPVAEPGRGRRRRGDIPPRLLFRFPNLTHVDLVSECFFSGCW